MLAIGSTRTIDRINHALANGTKQDLSPEDARLLEMYEFANKCVSKSKKIPTKRKLVKKIVKQFEISIVEGYTVLNYSEILFGKLDYPDLPANKIFSVRRIDFLINIAEEKFQATGVKEVYKIEYLKIIDKLETKKSKILGDFIHTNTGIDYSKWVRPKVVFTTNPDILKANQKILDKIADMDIEDVEFDDI